MKYLVLSLFEVNTLSTFLAIGDITRYWSITIRNFKDSFLGFSILFDVFQKMLNNNLITFQTSKKCDLSYPTLSTVLKAHQIPAPAPCEKSSGKSSILVRLNCRGLHCYKKLKKHMNNLK